MGTRAVGHSSPPRWRATAGRDVAAVERCDVGRLGSVENIAGREDPGTRRAQAGIDGGPAGRAGRADAGQDRELVVGDPVGGEDDQVALDLAGRAGVEVGELDRLDPAAAVNRADPGACVKRRRGSGPRRRP